MTIASTKDLGVETHGHVTLLEIRRPPLNFFDLDLIRQIAGTLDKLDEDADCRAIVLAAQGKAFCAGANFNRPNMGPNDDAASGTGTTGDLYREAVRIFSNKKPIVAAVQGAAIGGGLGLAVSADFRVTCPEARFAANFTRLGTHPGFGLTVTLPRLIGTQATEMMFYTGDRIPGDQAVAMGLADRLVPLAEVRSAAVDLATRIAQSAPLAVRATRATMRRGLADAVEAATDHEFVEQDWLFRTADFREGVRAMAARTLPDFTGR